jgi:hypothetical protein
MAVASYSSDLVDITTDAIEQSTTNWTMIKPGGAGSLSANETDYYIVGSNCLSASAGSISSPGRGMIYNNGSTTITSPKAVFLWGQYLDVAGVNTKSAGGVQVCIGSSATAYYEYWVDGSDTLIRGGWKSYAINPTVGSVSASNTTGSPTATKAFFGYKVLGSSAPTKGYPLAVDGIRYGREFQTTNGQSGSYGTFAGAAAYNDVSTRRYGQFSDAGGTYTMKGLFVMGTTATSVDFRDTSGSVIVIEATDFVTQDFNGFEVRNASSNVEWTGASVISLSTVSPGNFVVTAGTLTLDSCSFTNMRTFTFTSSTTATGCTFKSPYSVTASGSNMSGSQVLTPTMVAGAPGFIWNSTTDTDGKLDGMTFSKGTTSHHAIGFYQYASSFVLRDVTFTGFTNTVGSTAAPLYFPDTGSDRTWNITANGCSGLTVDGYAKARSGDTVNITLDQVTLTVEVRDEAGALVTDNTEVTVVRTSDTTVLHHEEDVADGSTSYVYTYSGDVATYVNVVSSGPYVPKTVEPVTLGSADQTVVVQLANDRAYSNP